MISDRSRERLHRLLIGAGLIGITRRELVYRMAKSCDWSDAEAELDYLIQTDRVQEFRQSQKRGRPRRVYRATTKILE